MVSVLIALATAHCMTRCVGPSISPPPFPILSVDVNTNFDLGHAIGTAFKSRITSWVTKYHTYTQVILPYINSASGRRNFLELKSANCGLFPQYCDELLGLSNATGLSHETFLAMSLRHELVTLARPGQILPDTLECTDVLTPHLYAHNEDGDPLLRETGFFVNATVRESKSTYFAFHYPASPAGHAFGYNPRSRFTSTMNAVFPNQVVTNGTGIYFLSRALLDSASVPDALALLRRHPSAYGGSFNLAQAGRNNVVNVEVSPGLGAVTTRDVWPSSFHMNNYLHSPGVAARNDTSSVHRLARARVLNATRPISGSDPGSLLRVLSDSNDTAYPLYRNGVSPTDHAATAATVMFNLATHPGVMHVYAHGPSDAEDTPCMEIIMW